MKRLLATSALLAILFVALPSPTAAANLPQILPSCDETVYLVNKTQRMTPEQYDEAFRANPTATVLTGYTTNKNCDFNDMLQLFMNLFNWGLYVLSVLALFFFFLGGGTLLLSGGSEERVRSGKAILTNTVYGVGIALGSWLIINVSIAALTGKEGSMGAYIWENQPWFSTSITAEFPNCTTPPEYPCKDNSSESVVRAVQELLYDGGCYIAPDTRSKEVDGSFGPKTLAAWRLWQRANNRPETSIMIPEYTQYSVSCRDAVQ